MRSALLLVLAACWGAPHPPGLGKLPGLVWITERPPCRSPGPIVDFTAEGNTATIVASDGVLARLDLATGKIVRERRLDSIHAANLVRLDPARWLAVGTWRGQFAARIVDDATFAATPIDLHAQPAKGDATASAARMPDGTIAISGAGLPLAVYDPKTLARVRTLDPGLGWHYFHLDGNRLLAYGNATTAAFDVTTGAKMKLDFFAAVHGSIVVRHTYATDKLEVRDGDKLLFDLHSDVLEEVKIDAAGTRMYVLGNGLLRVYEIPSGRELQRLDLGWRGRTTARIVLTGGKLVLASGALVQVVDLDKGTFSAPGAPPYSAPTQVIVRDDGAVLVIERAAWRFADGKLVTSVDPNDHDELNSPRGEVDKVATYGLGDKPLVVVRAVPGGGVVKRWQATQPILDGWLGANGEVAVTENDVPQRLLRSNGSELVEVARLPSETMIEDVDVDSGGAIVGAHGQIVRVRLIDGSHDERPMFHPGCEEYGKAVLEKGGDRVAAMSDHDVIVWQRGKDAPVGSAHFDEDVGTVTFMPHGGDVLADVGESLVLWNPATGVARTLALGAVMTASPSPDGKRVAIVFGDGRVALADLAALRAGMKESKPARAEIPQACPGADLLRVPPEESAVPDTEAPE